MLKVSEGFQRTFKEYSTAEKEFIKKDFQDKVIENQIYYSLICKYIEEIKLTANIRVLEIGCGTGRISCFLSSKFQNIEVYGIDILKESIDASMRTAEVLNCVHNIKFINCSAEDLPFADEFFHIVFSQGTIEHFKDITKVMNEQVRILNKKGYLIINVPQTFSYYTIKKHIKMMKNKWEPGWETQYSYFDFKKIAKKYNLKLIEIKGAIYDSKIRELIKIYKVIVKIGHAIPFFKKIDENIRKIWHKIICKYGQFFLVEIIGVFR